MVVEKATNLYRLLEFIISNEKIWCPQLPSYSAVISILPQLKMILS